MDTNFVYRDPAWEELIDGKIVVMPSRPTNHSIVTGNLYCIFGNYLEGKNDEVIGCGTDLYLSEKDRFIPDVMIICDGSKIKEDGVHGAPDLVVEVLSASTAKNDRSIKMDTYAKAGVKEYWIVTPNSEMIEQYLLKDGAFVLHDVYVVYPDYMLEKMNEEERAAVIKEFRCSLYDDLLISLQDVFANMLT